MSHSTSGFGETAVGLTASLPTGPNPHFLIVMEYCEKGSLRQVLTNKDYKLPWTRKAKMCLEAAQGLYRSAVKHIAIIIFFFFICNIHVDNKNFKNGSPRFDRGPCDMTSLPLLSHSLHLTWEEPKIHGCITSSKFLVAKGYTIKVHSPNAENAETLLTKSPDASMVLSAGRF